MYDTKTKYKQEAKVWKRSSQLSKRAETMKAQDENNIKFK